MARVSRGTPPARRGRDVVPPPTTYTVLLLAVGDNKVNVIQAIRSATGLGLAESRDLADRAPTAVREGIDRATAEQLSASLLAAGAQVQVTPPLGEPAKPPPPPPAITYTVLLLAVGDRKVNVIQAIRNATGLGLAEARDLADRAPTAVREGIDRATAEQLAASLLAAGAQVQITPP